MGRVQPRCGSWRQLATDLAKPSRSLRIVSSSLGDTVRQRHGSVDRACLYGLPGDLPRRRGTRKPRPREPRRGAAVPLPGGLGVQGGTLIAACMVFGVPAEAALGLALVKRIPDLVLGVPSLLVWQAMEGRRLLFKHK